MLEEEKILKVKKVIINYGGSVVEVNAEPEVFAKIFLGNNR